MVILILSPDHNKHDDYHDPDVPTNLAKEEQCVQLIVLIGWSLHHAHLRIITRITNIIYYIIPMVMLMMENAEVQFNFCNCGFASFAQTGDVTVPSFSSNTNEDLSGLFAIGKLNVT